LFFSLSFETIALFVGWAVVGLVVYYAYSYRRSHVGLGLSEVHETDADLPPPPIAPL
jgi:APA family basic amino acid/polyamine antiporter